MHPFNYRTPANKNIFYGCSVNFSIIENIIFLEISKLKTSILREM